MYKATLFLLKHLMQALSALHGSISWSQAFESSKLLGRLGGTGMDDKEWAVVRVKDEGMDEEAVGRAGGRGVGR